jgi:hypothetical protein
MFRARLHLHDDYGYRRGVAEYGVLDNDEHR